MLVNEAELKSAKHNLDDTFFAFAVTTQSQQWTRDKHVLKMQRCLTLDAVISLHGFARSTIIT